MRFSRKLSLKLFFTTLFLVSSAQFAHADAKVMNPGEAVGQLVILSADDVRNETPKFTGLTALSIPLFVDLPMDLSVVAGTITIAQQNLLSHVQLKSRARGTPNLDISTLEGGMSNPLLSSFHDGDYVHMKLTSDGQILLEKSTEVEALAFYNNKKKVPIHLRGDITTNWIFSGKDLTFADVERVGSKAANYAELVRALNLPDRTVVRPNFAVPFYYYQEFLDLNPAIKTAIEKVLRDPLMRKVSKVAYRDEKLKALREMILSPSNTVSQKLVDDLVKIMDTQIDTKGKKRNMRFRSSTNSEDLPNFNGAGLYTSEAYKPTKDGVEKPLAKKEESLRKALRTVWSSVWNTRAFEERSYFQIPHDEVKVGIEINPAFDNEGVNGVVVTKNIGNIPNLTGAGVYIEAQRGEKFSVTNPAGGAKPERIFVLIDAQHPLDVAAYEIRLLQKSNISDDTKTILPQDNPTPVMMPEEIKDLVYQSMKAVGHFKPALGANNPNFSLDIEFKVDSEDTGHAQVYMKQGRPYID